MWTAAIEEISAFVRTATWGRLSERTIALVAVLYIARKLWKLGFRGLVAQLLNATLKAVPGAQGAYEREMEKEADKTVATLFKDTPQSKQVVPYTQLPEAGISRPDTLKALSLIETMDCRPEKGGVFAYVYAWGDEKEKSVDAKEAERMTHDDLTAKAFGMFLHKNALSPMAFPSLRRLETEVVSMALSLVHGPPGACGTMTSGGTESVLMAVKAYRDYGRSVKGITKPNIVMAITAHFAFVKACDYFLVERRIVPVTGDMRADVAAMAKLIDSQTICLVGSAPQYPHGVVDPLEAIGELGLARNIPVHADACIGGFMLPFVEKLGFKVPLWDFRVRGVTSISADCHKYGYAPKGASVVMYRSDQYRKYQFWSYADWPGYVVASPSMLGTRGGGPIAGAWSSLVSLGEKGLMDKARELMETSQYLQREINSIPGLSVVGRPHMTVLAFTSTELNIFAIADEMAKRGWKVEQQHRPNCVHLTLMPVHCGLREKIIAALKESTDTVRANPQLAKQGTAALAATLASLPSSSIVEDFLKCFLQKVYSIRA